MDERINEFIKEEVKRRKNAAKALTKPFRVNDISMAEGYDPEYGLEVKEGIEELAELFEKKVEVVEVRDTEKYTYEKRAFVYDGIMFYQSVYDWGKENGNS